MVVSDVQDSDIVVELKLASFGYVTAHAEEGEGQHQADIHT